MNISCRRNSIEGGTNVPPKRFIRWLKLLISLIIIVFFIKIASFSERLPWIKSEFKALRDSGIQTGLFWWADVHEVAEAEKHFKKLNLMKQSSFEFSKSEKNYLSQDSKK